ncbi:nuclear transport factor 2 family protein [Rhizobium sp. G21]|uniref:nuclear transport factor 2 family protein n=1 Tax=Rhizobium sp. G21 TaxID=2758439 RepID=UPI001601961F|nr:nuclear transport factor 2 family protein [Rhizobium sp. G21]MBB1251428.1 nuclear transport factor 2 family protein [Rhizobium sp. G21]
MNEDDNKIIDEIYVRFNARDIDGVLEALDEDVAWANAMEGGHEQGREAVRAYWTRQWAVVSPVVTPKTFRNSSPNEIVVEVEQRVYDLEGRPLEGEQDHDLKDKTVKHIFQMKNGKVVRFDVA